MAVAYPEVNEGLKLHREPINYMKWRIKTLRDQENYELLCLQTKEEPDKKHFIEFDPGMDIPHG